MVGSHAQRACQLFTEGMNCAQAVFVAFDDVTGLDEALAMRLSSSFGGGMGRMREVCGAVSAMFMVAGILYGLGPDFDDGQKKAHYARIQKLAADFKAEQDSIICRELLEGLAVTNDPTPEQRTAEYYQVRPCVRFVRTAAEVLDRYIAAHPVEKPGQDL